MAKTLKTAAELTTLLTAELRKHEICDGVTVNEVTPVDDDRLDFTWTATIVRKSSEPVLGDCSGIFLSALRLLQRKYDLMRQGGEQI
jgi:hypothetical protein